MYFVKKLFKLFQLISLLLISVVLNHFYVFFKEAIYGNEIIYYKCKMKEEYYSNICYIPLCSYDTKFNTIHFFGYFHNKDKKKYIYKVINIPVFKYNNKVYNTNVNMSIQKIILTKKKISLCIVSIFNNINVINIIRTCLMYKHLGVDHITLYVSYYNPLYIKYYKWLIRQEWIDIIYFSIPKVSIFYYGQDSKLDHCINHYRYVSSYVIITDVDEIILPVRQIKLLEILKIYGKNNYVFSFSSVIFLVNSTKSNIFSANKKGCKITKWYKKMIIRPEKILSIGAHFPRIWQKEKGKIISINTKDAYVRHSRELNNRYKNCSFLYQQDYISKLIQKLENEINVIQT